MKNYYYGKIGHSVWTLPIQRWAVVIRILSTVPIRASKAVGCRGISASIGRSGCSWNRWCWCNCNCSFGRFSSCRFITCYRRRFGGDGSRFRGRCGWFGCQFRGQFRGQFRCCCWISRRRRVSWFCSRCRWIWKEVLNKYKIFWLMTFQLNIIWFSNSFGN